MQSNSNLDKSLTTASSLSSTAGLNTTTSSSDSSATGGAPAAAPVNKSNMTRRQVSYGTGMLNELSNLTSIPENPFSPQNTTAGGHSTSSTAHLNKRKIIVFTEDANVNEDCKLVKQLLRKMVKKIHKATMVKSEKEREEKKAKNYNRRTRGAFATGHNPNRNFSFSSTSEDDDEDSENFISLHEINLTKHPAKRKEFYQLLLLEHENESSFFVTLQDSNSGVLSTRFRCQSYKPSSLPKMPQVWFNNRYFGGMDEVEQLVNKIDEDRRIMKQRTMLAYATSPDLGKSMMSSTTLSLSRTSFNSTLNSSTITSNPLLNRSLSSTGMSKTELNQALNTSVSANTLQHFLSLFDDPENKKQAFLDNSYNVNKSQAILKESARNVKQEQKAAAAEAQKAKEQEEEDALNAEIMKAIAEAEEAEAEKTKPRKLSRNEEEMAAVRADEEAQKAAKTKNAASSNNKNYPILAMARTASLLKKSDTIAPEEMVLSPEGHQADSSGNRKLVQDENGLIDVPYSSVFDDPNSGVVKGPSNNNKPGNTVEKENASGAAELHAAPLAARGSQLVRVDSQDEDEENYATNESRGSSSSSVEDDGSEDEEDENDNTTTSGATSSPLNMSLTNSTTQSGGAINNPLGSQKLSAFRAAAKRIASAASVVQTQEDAVGKIKLTRLNKKKAIWKTLWKSAVSKTNPETLEKDTKKLIEPIPLMTVIRGGMHGPGFAKPKKLNREKSIGLLRKGTEEILADMAKSGDDMGDNRLEQALLAAEEQQEDGLLAVDDDEDKKKDLQKKLQNDEQLAEDMAKSHDVSEPLIRPYLQILDRAGDQNSNSNASSPRGPHGFNSGVNSSTEDDDHTTRPGSPTSAGNANSPSETPRTTTGKQSPRVAKFSEHYAKGPAIPADENAQKNRLSYFKAKTDPRRQLNYDIILRMKIAPMVAMLQLESRTIWNYSKLMRSLDDRFRQTGGYFFANSNHPFFPPAKYANRNFLKTFSYLNLMEVTTPNPTVKLIESAKHGAAGTRTSSSTRASSLITHAPVRLGNLAQSIVGKVVEKQTLLANSLIENLVFYPPALLLRNLGKLPVFGDIVPQIGSENLNEDFSLHPLRYCFRGRDLTQIVARGIIPAVSCQTLLDEGVIYDVEFDQKIRTMMYKQLKRAMSQLYTKQRNKLAEALLKAKRGIIGADEEDDDENDDITKSVATIGNLIVDDEEDEERKKNDPALKLALPDGKNVSPAFQFGDFFQDEGEFYKTTNPGKRNAVHKNSSDQPTGEGEDGQEEEDEHQDNKDEVTFSSGPKEPEDETSAAADRQERQSNKLNLPASSREEAEDAAEGQAKGLTPTGEDDTTTRAEDTSTAAPLQLEGDHSSLIPAVLADDDEMLEGQHSLAAPEHSQQKAAGAKVCIAKKDHVDDNYKQLIEAIQSVYRDFRAHLAQKDGYVTFSERRIYRLAMYRGLLNPKSISLPYMLFPNCNSSSLGGSDSTTGGAVLDSSGGGTSADSSSSKSTGANSISNSQPYVIINQFLMRQTQESKEQQEKELSKLLAEYGQEDIFANEALERADSKDDSASPFDEDDENDDEEFREHQKNLHYGGHTYTKKLLQQDPTLTFLHNTNSKFPWWKANMIQNKVSPMTQLLQAKMLQGKRIFHDCKHAHTQTQSGVVNFIAIKNSPQTKEDYDRFRLKISELQMLDLLPELVESSGEQNTGTRPSSDSTAGGSSSSSSLSWKHNKAFLINCYNLLCLHGFTEAGVVSKLDKRIYTGTHPYQQQTAYQFAFGFVLKLADLFQMVSPRKDYRVHFVLNHCTKSCPPIYWLDKHCTNCVEEELEFLSMLYCMNDQNVFFQTKESEETFRLGISRNKPSNKRKRKRLEVHCFLVNKTLWKLPEFQQQFVTLSTNTRENAKRSVMQILLRHLRGEKWNLLKKCEQDLSLFHFYYGTSSGGFGAFAERAACEPYQMQICLGLEDWRTCHAHFA
ncbi:unnamed protein product [Amoebophrya sp. A120]|nr:unnamed protein product [Amoebophrya sp. A120]|eukprot:GSA120T00013366001.1